MASTSAENKSVYQQWIIQENRNIMHILEDIPNSKPSLDSPKLHPTSIHIMAVVMKYKTPTGRLPTRPSTPIIMVGPATGLAAFRDFIQERDFARKAGKETGDTILYFGCRKSQEDYLYRQELEQYVKNGILTLHTAFSREQSHKIYVAHLLEKNKEEIWCANGEQNKRIYICGGAKNMACNVHNILLKLVMEHGNMSELNVANY
ncbi:NADPH--cytochrome P450 reductase [Cyphomyrmex costatus]|uniref:NADPH--hemoprotein reductase n=1 Tax=Cyphomyrmex costatus TaxID=456900 RepID=A0A151I6Q7_9HYME|nr:NADPH--cytochrome P450 reductase [Cyphomyrmex costatus]